MVEAVVAIGILSICGAIAYKTNFYLNSAAKERIEIFKEKESINAICNELKYNVHYKDLKEILINKEVSIPFDNSIMTKIKEESFLNNDNNSSKEKIIKVTLLNKETLEQDNFMNIRVYSNESDYHLEKEFKKSGWMENV